MSDEKSLADIIALSNDKLREFVLAYVDGRIFTHLHLDSPESLPLVFLPVALGAFRDWTEEQIEGVGCIYEYLSEAMPRSINGMPMFPSMRLLSTEQWEQASEAIRKEQKRRERIEV